MILTQCAVCATDLGLTRGKKCGRCSTRYCGAECQVQHWKEGGHDQLCKKIKKAGGAEQYNANKKYAEALAVAVEKCARTTPRARRATSAREGAKRRNAPDEGLVRMCACRGTAGFAHVSCLAEQAKILCAEAEENNLIGTDRFDAEVGRVAHVQPVRAKVPRRRVVRARVGVLEDVRGAAGGGLGSEPGDEPAWERFIRGKTPRGRVARERGRVGHGAARWQSRKYNILASPGQSCEHVSHARTA